MSKLDDFIIHSQYPMEKIVWMAEGNNDSTNPYWHLNDMSGQVFIPLPESLNWQSVFVDGVWTDDDWATQYQMDCDGKPYYNPQYDSIGSSQIYTSVFPKGTDIFGYIPPTDVVAMFGSTSESAGKTLKYRVWAYLLENDLVSTISMKTAELIGYDLQKDTRLAQLSLISENIVRVPNMGTRTLYHNLGFRPFCKMWNRTVYQGNESNWTRSLGTTLENEGLSYTNNSVLIDDEKIVISVKDEYPDPEFRAEQRDFLIRMYNYALPE